VKGIYVIQLRQGDFSYNGKDVTIWTAVETATAIIAASIPVLRVFFKEAVSSFSNSYGPSQCRSRTKPVPLSTLNRSRNSKSFRKGKDGGWTTIDDSREEGASQIGILQDEGGLLRDEEQALGSGGVVVAEHEGIMKTDTITITVDEDRKSQHKGRAWLDAPHE
jgi:hypothetical protein